MSNNKILKILSIVPEPRVERSKLHSLTDVLFIALCAIIAGAETYTDMAAFGNIHFDWFKRFLKLPNGIPSHDTFGKGKKLPGILTFLKNLYCNNFRCVCPAIYAQSATLAFLTKSRQSSS